MKKLDNNIWIISSQELRNSNPSDFCNGATIYLRPNKKVEFKYIITLKKNKSSKSSFSLFSTVEDYKTRKFLVTPGNKKGMRPYFIEDFLYRK